MRHIIIDDTTKGIALGYRQENEYAVITYLLPSDWTGSVEAFLLKPGEDASVPLIGLEQADDSVSFKLTTTDLRESGRGSLEFMCTMDGVVAKSKVFPVVVSMDIISQQTARPDEWESWVNQVAGYASEARGAASAAATSAAWSDERATDASQSANGAAQSAQSASESAGSAAQSASDASESAADAEEAKQTILNMTATAQTLPEGSDATVDYSNGVMAFGIPRGDKGAKGDKGETGETGATPNLSIGTVETLAPDESATATITGTAENPVLNLGLPKGETGDVSKAELASLMPLETVSGSVASFSDGSSVFDAEQALVTLEPIQSGSGTPSPDNVRPISGHDSASVVVSGINVWDEEWEVGGYDATTGEKTIGTAKIRNKNPIRCLPNTTYFFAGVKTYTSWVAFYWYDADGNFIKATAIGGTNRMFASPNGAYYMCWNTSDLYGTTYNHDISINYPSTDTEYHPSQGVEIYTTDLGRTVYGGTVDLVSGVLTVEKKLTEITSFSGTFGQRTYGYCVFKDLSDRGLSMDSVSNMFVLSGKPVDSMPIGTFQGSSGVNTTWSFMLPNTITSLAEANAWLANLPETLVVTETLATPQIIQLTPQAIALLTGDNNVWSDSGQIQVKYRANIGLYVDKKISEVSQ